MYYIVFGLLYLLSLLPLRILHLLSDLACFIIYYIIGYRKKIVLYNLSVAFPEKSEKERIKIAKRFYQNFTDNFIETIKLISACDAWIKKHFTGNLEIFAPLYEQGRKCQVHLGHNFNWELANMAMPLYSPYTLLTVYMPITNKTVDRLFRHIRTRTGAVLLPANHMHTAMVPYRNKKFALALVADQNPGNLKNAYWVRFFGRPTPFLKGPEKGAKGMNAAVLFCYITKQKRGYYQTHLILAETEAAALPETVLTKRYVAFLEEVIRANPDMWLWTHRRWKHEWKPEYGEVMETEIHA